MIQTRKRLEQQQNGAEERGRRYGVGEGDKMLSTDAVSALLKGSGTNMTVEATESVAPKHARKHETHPHLVRNKSSFSFQTIVVLFALV